MRTISLVSILFFLLLQSCKSGSSTDTVNEADEMKKADLAFSDLSKEKGMRAAFLEYIDSAGVLLRPGHYPFVGINAQHYLEQVVDSSFTLTWEPEDAIVARSGELGYTYGLYSYSDKDTSFQGTYVSIWKKNKDGKWKFVLDTGNPGVDREK